MDRAACGPKATTAARGRMHETGNDVAVAAGFAAAAAAGAAAAAACSDTEASRESTL